MGVLIVIKGKSGPCTHSMSGKHLIMVGVVKDLS